MPTQPISTTAFGKSIEHWIFSQMLKEGFDVYVPLVDEGIDAVVGREDGSFITVQIKSTSEDRVKFGDAGFFANIKHKPRGDYWFIFYSERMDAMWILNSKQFKKVAKRYANDKWDINFVEKKDGQELPKPQFEKYMVENSPYFDRLKARKKCFGALIPLA